MKKNEWIKERKNERQQMKVNEGQKSAKKRKNEWLKKEKWKNEKDQMKEKRTKENKLNNERAKWLKERE